MCAIFKLILQQVGKTETEKKQLSHVFGNYCNSLSFSLQLLFVCHVKIYFRVD